MTSLASGTTKVPADLKMVERAWGFLGISVHTCLDCEPTVRNRGARLSGHASFGMGVLEGLRLSGSESSSSGP